MLLIFLFFFVAPRTEFVNFVLCHLGASPLLRLFLVLLLLCCDLLQEDLPDEVPRLAVSCEPSRGSNPSPSPLPSLLAAVNRKCQVSELSSPSKGTKKRPE